MQTTSLPVPVVSPSSEPQRWLFLDLVRILSASLLFYFHLGLSISLPLSGLASNTTAVFIFLIGFCAIRFSGRHDPDTPSARDWMKYPLARLAKLLPIFWLVCFLLFAASFVHPASTLSEPFSFEEFAMNLFGLNQYFGDRYLTRTMWFVPFVVQVYFLIPVFRRIPFRPVLTMAGAFAISSLLCLLAFRIRPDIAQEICRAWSPLFRLPMVYLGIALAMSRTRADVCKILASFTVGASLLAVAAPHRPDMAITLSRPLESFLFGLLIMSCSWFLSRPLNGFPFAQKLITTLGKASYPFFLIHGAMITFLWQTFGKSPMVWISYFAACWGMAVTICVLDRGLRKQFVRLKASVGRREEAPASPLEDALISPQRISRDRYVETETQLLKRAME
ncbi:MAG TPA: acyltransferase family protein [Chthoniobacterales bacterium]|nr:acyltransferase family protein [Chthoniobacterales bacterium]